MARSHALLLGAHVDGSPGPWRRGVRQGDVLAHRALHEEALDAIAGHEHESLARWRRPGGGTRPDARRPRSVPPDGRRDARQDAEELVLALALERHEAEHLAGAQLERDVRELGVRGEVAERQTRHARRRVHGATSRRRRSRQERRARLADAVVDRGLVLGRRAEHELDDALLRARAHVHDADGLAVAQDRGAVAERADLQEAVRDEDDRATRLALAPTSSRTLLGEVGRERGGHLVEQQDVRLERPGARQVHDAQHRRAGRRRRIACRSTSRDAELRQPAPAKASTGVRVRRRLDRTSRSGMSAGSW